MDATPSGFRLLPHTADVIVEAWAPDREGCLREAVHGLVAVFADVGRVTPTGRLPVTLPADGDGEPLMSLLEEVLYLLDIEDVVPVDAEVDATQGALHVVFLVAPVEAVEQQGALPKAIAHHGLSFGQESGRWRCRVMVDV
jgi:SHS2 domain-containing protein